MILLRIGPTGPAGGPLGRRLRDALRLYVDLRILVDRDGFPELATALDIVTTRLLDALDEASRSQLPTGRRRATGQQRKPRPIRRPRRAAKRFPPGVVAGSIDNPRLR